MNYARDFCLSEQRWRLWKVSANECKSETQYENH